MAVVVHNRTIRPYHFKFQTDFIPSWSESYSLTEHFVAGDWGFQ